MLNKAAIIGNVGEKPAINQTNSGDKIANFSVATTETWKDKQTGEKKSRTEWHRVVAFSQGLVNVIENYVDKGTKLYIEGKIQTRKWQDNSGADRYSTEIVLNGFDAKLVLLGGRPENETKKEDPQHDNSIEGEEIPF